MRDRESLFNEYILEVRRREKDEKVQKKETVSETLQRKISATLFFLFSVHSFFATNHINYISKPYII